MRKKEKNKVLNSKKELLTKRNISCVILFILILIACLVSFFVKFKRTNEFSGRSPEDRRAMNYEEFTDGDDAVYVDGTQNTDNEQIVDSIKFSSFFLRDLNGDGYAEKLKGTCKEVGKEDTLYIEIIVQTAGSLKNGKIQIDNKNFYFQTVLPKDNEIKANYIGNNIKTIEFENLDNGIQKMIIGNVRSGDYSYDNQKLSALENNIDNYSRNDNKIILTGTYVAADGTETDIRKEIPLIMDWYGTTSTTLGSLNQTNNNLLECLDTSNKTLNLKFTVQPIEIDNKLLLSKNSVQGMIPELNGYEPTNVSCSSTGIVFDYDKDTRNFTIIKEAKLGDNNDLIKLAYDRYNANSRLNQYTINVSYPIEAYESLDQETMAISIPVESYYEGYNNANSEFMTPFKSNIAKETITAIYRKPQEAAAKFEIKVGKYVTNPTSRYFISKKKPLRIYNEISSSETDDTYVVQWRGLTGINGETSGMVMKETKNGETRVVDRFIKSDTTEESMEDVLTNKGIWMTYAEELVGEDGWIKVYDDETDDLLVTFTKNGTDGSKKWDQYSAANPYYYSTPVKHIRLETSSTNAKSEIMIYNLKELNDSVITEKYTKEEFDNLKYIKSTLVGYLGDVFVNVQDAQAIYENPFLIADIEINKNVLSTQITEENFNINIRAEADEYINKQGWTNGTFLIKLPDEILTTIINSVNVDNNSVNIISYEIIEKDRHKFIKIKTTNQNPLDYVISLDLDITPDPRIASVSRELELYAISDDAESYYYNSQDIYDVDDDGNIEEVSNLRSASVSLFAPNSLLTNQTMSEFDDQGTVIVSPQIADLKPIYSEDDIDPQTVKIGVQIKNNYAGTISEAKILGKIPFEGNTYVVSERDLNSDYSTQMVNSGVEVPTELLNDVTVYYSENENPSRDLLDSANGWTPKENVTDWSRVKTYLIDLEDTIIEQGAEYTFYYVVKIPVGLEFNKISYSHHGIYFSLDTPEGRLRTSTEPNKIGVRIADKYNLELTKFQINKNRNIGGAVYKVSKINAAGEVESSSTAKTNAQGKLEMANLYSEIKYEIREISSPANYELNEDVIGIIGHINRETGVLTVEKLYGETKNTITVVKNVGEDYKAKVEVEDEVRASLKITKKDKDTSATIRGIKYKITGTGFPSTGRIVTTNVNGEINLSGIKIGEEYTLEETKAEGYYLARSFVFKVINNNGTYNLQVKDEDGNFYDLNEEGKYIVDEIKEIENLKTSTISEIEDLPIINLGIVNEKIPTYDLEITKIKHITEVESGNETVNPPEITYIQGAKFKLYKGGEEIGTYTSDENGKFTITGLFQFVEEKGVEQTYVLKESYAPEGYSKVKDIVFKVSNIMGVLSYEETLENGQKEKEYTIEGNTVKLIVEDNPSFKLIKKDGETNELLPNTKFSIFNIDEGTVPARNSKGEIVGEKEIIDGQEYYIVTTDSNGEISIDLPEGMYKAKEVETDDKYDLSQSDYYFGINASREAKLVVTAEWLSTAKGSYYDQGHALTQLNDGSFVIGGLFGSTSLDFGKGVIIDRKGGDDGYIAKYSTYGEIQWAECVGGPLFGDAIRTLESALDGGFYAGGYFQNTMALNNSHSLSSSGGKDGLLLKYSLNGNVEWEKKIGGNKDDEIYSVLETSDGGFIVSGYFKSASINLGNGIIISNNGSTDYYDGMIIKFNQEKEVEWAKSLGGPNHDYIKGVAETEDGEIIVVGYYFSDSIFISDGVYLNNSGETDYSDAFIIKYDLDGNYIESKNIGNSNSDTIENVCATSDGGYAICGTYVDDLNLGEITLNKYSTTNGMVIKYSEDGNIDWGKGFGDVSLNEVISNEGNSITVGGIYTCSELKIDTDITLTNPRNNCGVIIKFDSYGNGKWGKNIGGCQYMNITGMIEAEDKEIVTIGTFQNGTLNIDGLTSINNASNTDTMLIKLNEKMIPNIDLMYSKSIGGSNTDAITSIKNTKDNGYIAGGYFRSSSMTIDGNTIRTKGDNDGLLIRYDNNGSANWVKSFGGSGDDKIQSVSETEEGNYIVGGYFSGNITINENRINSNGSTDALIIKYDNNGDIIWANSFGGTGSDGINSVLKTKDEGCIAVGYFTNSIVLNHETVVSKGGKDAIIVKYDSDGRIEWYDNFGGDNDDIAQEIVKIGSDNYVLIGNTESSSLSINSYNLLNHGERDGFIVKYSDIGNVLSADIFGGNYSESINTIASTKDGGYIIGGNFKGTITVGNHTLRNYDNSSYYEDGFLVKYDINNNVEWTKSFGSSTFDKIISVIETDDGGFLAGGYFQGNISIGGHYLSCKGSYDGVLIKYSDKGEPIWALGIGGSNWEEIMTVSQTDNGRYIVGGYYSSASISLDGNTILNNNSSSTSYYDGMILNLKEEIPIQETTEVLINNFRKEYKITTDIKEIDGIKGGIISGEDDNPFEIIKYGDSNTKEVKMIPDENYEIIKITVNGEEWPYSPESDGSYSMPTFENIKENKHIVVTYSLKNNKITINKKDSVNGTSIEGAEFRLDQIEERTEPVNSDILDDPTDNGDYFYDIVNKETDIETDSLRSLTENGETYLKVEPINNEIVGKFGTLVQNNTYYFEDGGDGTLIPTNGKTYQRAHGGTTGKHSTIANSYMEVNLSGLTGKYTVVVNARVSSESNYDFGYATINQSQEAPTHSISDGRFMFICGTITNMDYVSSALNGGEVYYLHLGYRKDNSQDSGEDQVVINSIKLYEAEEKNVEYNFIETDGKYESTNQGKDSTVCNSYIPIDLTNKEGKYGLVVNAEVSSQSNYDYGYATISTTADRVSQSTAAGRFINISGNQSAKDYSTELDGGQMYYLHLGYSKNEITSSNDDKFTINSVNLYRETPVQYGFEEESIEENGETRTVYRPTNQGKNSTVCNSYIPVYLEGYTGKYNITVNAEISSQSGDYGYVTLNSTDSPAPAYNSNTTSDRRFVYITGIKTAQDYTIEVDGGYNYCLHLGYYKDSSTNTNGDDIFTINDINVSLSDSELYHTTIETNSEGKAITQIPFGKYQITEIKTNENYILDEIPTVKDDSDNIVSENGIIEFRSTDDSVHEFTIENEKYGHVKVHHYLKGTTTSVADEEELTGVPGEEYTTLPKNLAKYELEKDIDGVEILPTNRNGIYAYEDQDVIYYYVPKSGIVLEHHYIINSIIGVPLSNGERAHEVVHTGNLGEGYTTSAISSSDLSADYEIFSVPSNANGTYADEPIDVVYYYKAKSTSVIVHHYIEGTDINVPLNGGGEASSETYEGSVGDEYITHSLDENALSNEYELVEEPRNKEGHMTLQQTVVIYYYKLKDTSVLVHHYYENTTSKISEDVLIPGKVGDEYRTEPATDIPDTYELLENPYNKNGTMVVGQTEVIYYYKPVSGEIIIHKYGMEGEPLENAEFRVSKGSIEGVVNSTTTYNGIRLDTSENYNSALKELTKNGTYYFEESNVGDTTAYVPTNSRTWRTANISGATSGVNNTTANSYIPIDLSEMDGKYAVVVNARVSSESNYDFGYITINQNTTAPTYSSSNGRFCYLSGIRENEDYTSKILEGRNIYYLHLGYRKDSSQDGNEDQIVINSINVYSAEEVTETYGFDDVDGKLISNNQYKDNTTANSYIPIDLTDKDGDYAITVNADISSGTGDCGYATINQTTGIPTYDTNNTNNIRFMYITGNVPSRDYTTTIVGGNKYYLHLGYYKNNQGSGREDKLTINSIKINGEDVNSNIYKTNEEGVIRINADGGTYSIVESNAPDGYVLNPEIKRVTVGKNNLSAEVSFTNEKIKGTLIVHHYIEGTTNSVPLQGLGYAEDEVSQKYIGTHYDTYARTDISDKYETIGTQDNPSGEYVDGETVVTYYYRRISGNLRINKIDKDTREPIEGVEFGIFEEDYNRLDVEDGIKVGNIYNRIVGDKADEAGIQLELVTPNGWTGFEEIEGKYIPQSSSWYVNNIDNGYEGSQWSDAYVYINLENKSEDEYFILSTDVEMRTNSISDRLYVWFSDGYLGGNWIELSGENSENKEIGLRGGKTYRLQLEYYKGSSLDIEDYAEIKMKLYNAENGRVETINDVPTYMELNSLGEEEDYNFDILSIDWGEPFVKVNEKYVPSTCQVYKDENGASSNGWSDSYFEIDLSDKEGCYAVVINAETSGFSGNEGLYACINDSLNWNQNFIDIHENTAATDYYQALEGGNKYYLMLEYGKDSGEEIKDYAALNSIKLYKADATKKEIGFEKTANGKYISNNKGLSNTIAHSVTPIDLRDYTGNIELTVNAEISSEESNDYGRVFIADVFNWNDNADYWNELMSISGRVPSQDYTLELEGGKLYYLHMSYEKNWQDYNDVGDDTFTINSIRIETTRLATLRTDDNGMAETILPTNNYTLVELEPKEGYDAGIPQKVELTKEGLNVTIENEKTKGKVVVNHFVEGTDENIVDYDDEEVLPELKKGEYGEEFNTQPRDDLSEKYEIVDSPPETSGIYTQNPQTVTYYYRLKKYPYIVNYLLKDSDNDDSNNTQLKDQKSDGTTYNYGTIINSEEEVEKIDGYKFDSTSLDQLRITGHDNEITIYYTIDENQTEEVMYNVEYYKDDEKQDADTQNEIVDVQVLLPKIIEVNKTKINTVDKYVGYKLEKITLNDEEVYDIDIENAEEKIYKLPDQVEDGDIIKVYYTKESYEYCVKYFYDDVQDVDAMEVGTAKYQEIIEDYIDKVKQGYRLKEKVLPIQITEISENNVMNVYYVTDDSQTKEITYKVEYYKNNKEVLSDAHNHTETVQIFKPNTISVDKTEINIVDKYEGYELDKITVNDESVSVLPDSAKDNDVIKVYYKAKDSQIIVKYIDEEGNSIRVDYVINGKVDETFDLRKVNDVVEGYDLVSKSKEGIVKLEPTTMTVIYTYRRKQVPIKDAKVIAIYKDEDSKKEIATQEIKKGHIGDTYNTIQKDIEGYDFVRVEGNKEGQMQAEETIITYWYKKKSPKEEQKPNNTNKTPNETKLSRTTVITNTTTVTTTTNTVNNIINVVNNNVFNNSPRQMIQSNNQLPSATIQINNSVPTSITQTSDVQKETTQPSVTQKETTQQSSVQKNDTEEDKVVEKVNKKETPNTGDRTPMMASGIMIIVLTINALLTIVLKNRKE